MSVLTEKIKSKGFWRVVIRPITFNRARVPNRPELLPLVSRLVVNHRGWSFPHIGEREESASESDWIQQEIDWDRFVEVWRMHQSGQFLYLAGFPEDWLPEADAKRYQSTSGPRKLGIGRAICRFTEFLRFASNLALSVAGAEQMRVIVDVKGIRGRQLVMDSPSVWGLGFPRTAYASDSCHDRVFSREELVADSDLISAAWVKEYFSNFDYAPNDDLVAALRREWF